MKKLFRISLAIAAVVLISALPVQAERGFRGGGGGHGGGPGWGPLIGLGVGLGLLGLTYPYYSHPYYPEYNQTPIILEPPSEVYVQPGPQQAAEQNYWYYCQDADGYYPYVKQCPGGWMKVIPSPPQQ